MTTITMLFNHTSQAYQPAPGFHSTTSRSNPQLLSWQNAIMFLTLLRIFLPIYPIIIALVAYSPLQRYVLYAHKGRVMFLSSSSSDAVLDNPEARGFLRNQVTVHSIPTLDGKTLYSWLIMPLGAYKKHESVLGKSWSAEEASEIAIQILRSDSKAVLVVYLHGNGNNLATEWRCQSYRNLSSGSPDHLYVLALDYRGFGRSTGSPTEEGLIMDAVSALTWAEKKLYIPRNKTLILGHSLGSAVALAAVSKVMETYRFAEYAGLVLCSAFTDTPSLAATFKIGGWFPVLAPLARFKSTRNWINQRLITDSWRSEQRLKTLVLKSEVLRLSILHAIDDDRVPHTMSEILYSGCVDEIKKGRHLALDERNLDLGAMGTIQEMKADGRIIRKVVLKNGGHNIYMNWHTVSYEVARILTMAGAVS